MMQLKSRTIYHSRIKTELIYWRQYKKKLKKILNLKLAVMWEYQNIKTFLQKIALEIRPKKIFWSKKLKHTVP